MMSLIEGRVQFILNVCHGDHSMSRHWFYRYYLQHRRKARTDKDQLDFGSSQNPQIYTYSGSRHL